MKPRTCAYEDSITITDSNAAVTIVAYHHWLGLGGHTHLAFEYPTSIGFSGSSVYRHVVFHLVSLGGGCGQLFKGTGATVLKQVRTASGGYGYAGGDGAVGYAKKKYGEENVGEEREEGFRVLSFDDRERDLPNNDEWLRAEYASQSVPVPPAIAKKGHLLCRRLSLGGTEEGIESQRFHKLYRSKGTNCVRFAVDVLRKLDIEVNHVFVTRAKTSPPKAIEQGTLAYVAS